MSRYIDADVLKDTIRIEDALPATYAMLCAWIDHQPTAKVVKVTHCMSCIHHTDEEPGMVYCPAIGGGWVENEFFCADGEDSNKQ